MKNGFLQKISFLAKSQGRHGTHSPFVYQFVEDVIQDKRHFYAFEKLLSHPQYEHKLIKLIFKTVLYLQPEHIYTNDHGIEDLSLNVDARIRIHHLNKALLNNSLIICNANEIPSEDIIFNKEINAYSLMLLHTNFHCDHNFWKNSRHADHFQLILNCGDFGLFIKDDKFKAHQQFWLK